MDLWSTGWCDAAKWWSEYGFREGFNTNVVLENPNEVGKCRDEIGFCRKFVNLGIYFT
jgi:hypothetical protein